MRGVMLVWATRTLPEAVIRGLILLTLFVIVVVLEIGLSTGLLALGLNSAAAFTLAGVVVLTVVLSLNWFLRSIRVERARGREAARKRNELPDGPCCLVLEGPDEPPPLPWDLRKPIRTRYPPLARRLGVEGIAVAAFEIGADGRAKGVRCVESWPSDMFFRAASSALKGARFRPPQGRSAQLSATYQLPFVFRLGGLGERHSVVHHLPASSALAQRRAEAMMQQPAVEMRRSVGAS
ncbi:MAG: energy transducer TonB [Hyphomonadaceae bacterium]|nr:energy transducer TonB [Hyphomonadaceae bacterium]